MDLEQLFSDRARKAVASEIREILKVMNDPEVISFAGGIPNPETFPVEQITKIACKVLSESPNDTLQYGTTEGHSDLRETLADYMKQQGVSAGPDDVLVTSGATQTIDLCSQAFLQAGRHVITESPSFLAALLDFRSHSAEIDDVPMDRDGIEVDALAERIAALKKKGAGPTLLYVIPNFQNPTGVTLSEKRRKRLVELAEENEFLILEDDPYGRLRFEGDPIRPVKAFDDSGRVIYASSFSKILSPGLRIGWAVAHPEVTKKLAIMKQTTDVHTSVFSQRIADEYIRGGHLERQLTKIKELYGRKQRVMLAAMEKYFPDGAEWTHPEGGMFLWATLPECVDTLEMLPKSLERKVAYMHGRLFYPNGGGENEMRLNFTHAKDELLTEGVKRLGALIEEEMRAH